MLPNILNYSLKCPQHNLKLAHGLHRTLKLALPAVFSILPVAWARNFGVIFDLSLSHIPQCSAANPQSHILQDSPYFPGLLQSMNCKGLRRKESNPELPWVVRVLVPKLRPSFPFSWIKLSNTVFLLGQNQWAKWPHWEHDI